MTVSVVVPYRPDGAHRDAAWSLLQQWWATTHPDWQVVTGLCPPGPWCKAAAVAAALPNVTGDVMVLADADVWTTGVDYAVQAVEAGAPWCVPHQRVQRLTAAATAAVLAGGPLPKIGPGHRGPHPQLEESYVGMVGGGMVVLPCASYSQVPLDPRFLGYGLEDGAWGLSLRTVLGEPPRRGGNDLIHLWHQPQPRITRAVGSAESLALYRRYRVAARSPAEMAALMAEAL